jgi:hypothetical protein
MARTNAGATAGRRNWTPQELGVLRKMAPTRPVGLIANELRRSEAAVRSKASQESISFGSPERSPYGKPVARKSARTTRGTGSRGKGR